MIKKIYSIIIIWLICFSIQAEVTSEIRFSTLFGVINAAGATGEYVFSTRSIGIEGFGYIVLADQLYSDIGYGMFFRSKINQHMYYRIAGGTFKLRNNTRKYVSIGIGKEINEHGFFEFSLFKGLPTLTIGHRL